MGSERGLGGLGDGGLGGGGGEGGEGEGGGDGEAEDSLSAAGAVPHLFASYPERRMAVATQHNGHDCGLYMLKYIELLATHQTDLAQHKRDAKKPVRWNWNFSPPCFPYVAVFRLGSTYASTNFNESGFKWSKKLGPAAAASSPPLIEGNSAGRSGRHHRVRRRCQSRGAIVGARAVP